MLIGPTFFVVFMDLVRNKNKKTYTYTQNCMGKQYKITITKLKRRKHGV